MNIVYVTGNPSKAKYFSRIIGTLIEHHGVDVQEIQSLNPVEVVKHKAKSAYDVLKKPVLVEDTSLSFNALGRLPGTFIKFFHSELGSEGLCRLIDSHEDKSAVINVVFCYYDGADYTIFERTTEGSISSSPKGSGGFGWDQVFISKDQHRTSAELSLEEYEELYKNVKPFDELKKFLANLLN